MNRKYEYVAEQIKANTFFIEMCKKAIPKFNNEIIDLCMEITLNRTGLRPNIQTIRLMRNKLIKSMDYIIMDGVI